MSARIFIHPVIVRQIKSTLVTPLELRFEEVFGTGLVLRELARGAELMRVIGERPDGTIELERMDGVKLYRRAGAFEPGPAAA